MRFTHCATFTTTLAPPTPPLDTRRLRESMGVTTDSSQRAFKEQDVVALYQRPRRDVKIPYRAVYIGVDPAGGGNSAFSICSLGRTMDGGVTVRVAHALPQFVPKAHCERMRAPSNQNVWVLSKFGQIHRNERVEQQQCDACRSDTLTELALLFDKIGGDFMFCMDSKQKLCTLANEAYGGRLISQCLLHDVLDGIELPMGLVKRHEQRLQTCKVLVECLSLVTEKDGPERRFLPHILLLEVQVLALTVVALVCARHDSQMLGMEALRTQGPPLIHTHPTPHLRLPP